MRSLVLLRWMIALCAIILVASAVPAAAERRVALVVGNAQYKNANLNLLNPKNDAEDVAAVLRALDFEVILAVDATKRDFDVAMTKFARAANGADAALFFYAGHALQFQGRNYMMPIDGEIEDEISLRYQLTPLDDVRAAVERADGVKIIILDACRNNPVVEDLRRKTMGANRSLGAVRGLARIDKALGMVVAYATAADDVAADGTGRNSPFSSALLRRLQEPGLEIGSMFRRIAADVNEKTNGRQRPETYVSLIGEYYLNQKDKIAWDQVKDSADAMEFRNFIARFPSSSRASDAQYRLQMLERLARERPADLDRLRNDARPAVAAAAPPLPAPALANPRNDRIAAVPPPPAQVAPAPVIAPAPAAQIPSAQLDVCKRDEARLIRLRANPVREEVGRFERELGCPKLRHQLARLRESVGPD